ncbi:hypothetical protein NQ314_013567 [Rhamnusium bicolor]|uniref:Uncharacterized protein n=1 Tax=Rhamnusium bicolor TaxID=1586634 RepID=A0AAV8X6Q4_9CUCU|nr:hypothetical protein NQ314_013567 [Rhamnusium bicolor]
MGLTPEQREMLLAIHNECVDQTGVTDDTVMRAMAGEFLEDPKFKEHLFCFTKKMGFQNEAGELQPDVIKEKTAYGSVR